MSAKVAAASGHALLIDDESVTILEVASGEVVATGRPCNGLYAMEMTTILPHYVGVAKSRAPTLQMYHERLAHQDKKHVQNLLRTLNIPVVHDENDFCEGCAMGKTHRLPYHSRRDRAAAVGEVFHADTNGPMRTTSLGGARFFVCLKDDFSRYRRLFFLERKTVENIRNCLEEFLNEANARGHVVRQLRTDSGTEYVNKEVEKLLKDRGIEHLRCPAYSPELNGSSEREMRTIIEAARSMLNSSGLVTSLWAESCSTASYILNRTGKSARQESLRALKQGEDWRSRKPARLRNGMLCTHTEKTQGRQVQLRRSSGILGRLCQ